MSAERIAAWARPYRWEFAWGVFALVNLGWMIAMPNWVSVPFHFIWVSITVLYGFRLWSTGFTWTMVGLVVGSTGAVLIELWVRGMPTDEVLEVPLMFGMFLAMMVHTSRRGAAIAALQRVSEENTRLLRRERAFIQNASHELRTPITVALAHAELAQLTAVKASVHEDVEIIVDELARLRRLTDRLLMLAAVDAPELVRPVPVDLAALADATLRRWGPTPRRWTRGRRDEAVVLADPERLTLALDAVLDNAINATVDGDLIEVSVNRLEDTAVIEVSDNGAGIPPEMLDSIFERFARAEAQPPIRAGFGLGLAIVNSIAETHGGWVTARNNAGGGAVVALCLPLVERRVGHAGRRHAVPGTPGHGHAATVADRPVSLA